MIAVSAVGLLLIVLAALVAGGLLGGVIRPHVHVHLDRSPE